MTTKDDFSCLATKIPSAVHKNGLSNTWAIDMMVYDENELCGMTTPQSCWGYPAPVWSGSGPVALA